MFERSFLLQRGALRTLVLLLAAVGLGCQPLDTKWDRWWFQGDEAAVLPDKVLPIWTDTVLHQPNQPGIRGFGGRLYFYKEGDPHPVKVDGQLTVYVFDGERRDPARTAPLKKYVITADQLASHHAKSSIGHSYSVWIPWDVVGGPNRTLSLVARLDGRDGGTVLAPPANKMLPGVSTSVSVGHEAQPAAYTSLVVPQANDSREDRLTTFSIALPPSFQRRLSHGPSNFPTAPQTTSGVLGHAKVDSIGLTQPITDEGHRQTSAPPVGQTPQIDAARSEPQRFPARRVPRVQPGRAPVRRLPHPAGWPSALPPTPRIGTSTKSTPPWSSRVTPVRSS